MNRTVKSNGRLSGTKNTALKQYAENNDGLRVYKDVMGYQGSVIDKRAEFYEEGEWGEKFEKFDSLVRDGIPLRKAAEKSLDTGRVSLPVFVSDDIVDTDEKLTPIAEVLPRVAVDSTEIRIDEITELGKADSFDEDGEVPSNNDTIEKYVYNVHSYGRKNRVTDMVQLAASRYNPRDMKISQQAKSVRLYEEEQALMGTDADEEGFEGLNDWVTDENTFDAELESATKSKVRDLITELELTGLTPDDTIIVTDVRSYANLKDSVDDFLRFDSPDDTLSFGFKTLEVDGVPVVKSQGLPDVDDDRVMFGFDASNHWFGMLRDLTVTPIAQGVDGSDVSQIVHTHAFGTFVSQAKQRIVKYENLA